MNIAQRFTIMVKASITAVFESIEDPERSLHQLVLDMEEELEAAKCAASKAMANEDRLRAQVELHAKSALEWQSAAENALARGDEDDAREALRRAEASERQRDELRERLAIQEKETADVRESILAMHGRIGEAKARLQLLQAKLRQGEARRAIGTILRRVEHSNLHAEFERIGDRVEQDVAADAAYVRLDAELSGDDLKRRLRDADLDDAVERRLEALRAKADRGSRKRNPKAGNAS